MKVLYILHETSPDKGSWKAAKGLLMGLREMGVDLLVVVPDSNGIFSQLKDEGFNLVMSRYIWDDTKLGSSLRQKLEWLPRMVRRKFYEKRWMSRMKRVCAEFNPDVIHSNSSVITNGYKLSRCLGVAHVWHIREYGDLDFGLSLKESNRLIKKNRYSISITRGVREHRGLSSNPDARVIYDGVCDENGIAGQQPKDTYFLYVGALIESKGIKDLIDAWAVFRSEKPDSRYVLKICGGSVPQIDKWKEYARRVGIWDSVVWLGVREDVSELMGHAAAVVIPSRSEGFGLVMPEALAAGALVIGRNTGGTKEQFENGFEFTGDEIGIPYETDSGLVEALRKVSENEVDASDMILRGQKALMEYYTVGSSARSVLGLYEEILANQTKDNDKKNEFQ